MDAWPSCQIPRDHDLAADGTIEAYEEAGVVWLWAHPELLDWQSSVVWLFSPPAPSPARFPGDLWGFDTNGELIVVENKRLHSGMKSCDPFKDHERPVGSARLSIGDAGSTTEVIAEWERLMAHEAKAPFPLPADRPTTTAPGILPYSCQRVMLWRWFDLHDRIHRRIHSPDYRHQVAEAAARRRERGDPPPHVLGMATVAHVGAPALSPTGTGRYHRLRAASPNNIHLRAFRATQDGDRARIERIPFPSPASG